MFEITYLNNLLQYEEICHEGYKTNKTYPRKNYSPFSNDAASQYATLIDNLWAKIASLDSYISDWVPQ